MLNLHDNIPTRPKVDVRKLYIVIFSMKNVKRITPKIWCIDKKKNCQKIIRYYLIPLFNKMLMSLLLFYLTVLSSSRGVV